MTVVGYNTVEELCTERMKGKKMEINDPESVLLILKNTRAKIEEGWTQGGRARDAEDFRCLPTSPQAVSWCVLGAMDVTTRDVGSQETLDTARVLTAVLPRKGDNLVSYNDHEKTTKKKMLTLFDRAIEKVMKGQ